MSLLAPPRTQATTLSSLFLLLLLFQLLHLVHLLILPRSHLPTSQLFCPLGDPNARHECARCPNLAASYLAPSIRGTFHTWSDLGHCPLLAVSTIPQSSQPIHRLRGSPVRHEFLLLSPLRVQGWLCPLKARGRQPNTTCVPPPHHIQARACGSKSPTKKLHSINDITDKLPTLKRDFLSFLRLLDSFLWILRLIFNRRLFYPVLSCSIALITDRLFLLLHLCRIRGQSIPRQGRPDTPNKQGGCVLGQISGVEKCSAKVLSLANLELTDDEWFNIRGFSHIDSICHGIADLSFIGFAWRRPFLELHNCMIRPYTVV